VDYKLIEVWLSGSGDGYGDGDGSGSGSGDGYGDGSGDGYGDGSGDGYGDGSGDGIGDGSGYGSGYGYGDGYGDGSGYASGYGSGDGSGDGSGYGYLLKKYNSNIVYYIDKIPTIISSITNNFAKGYIIGDDMRLSDCYIAKSENWLFAHGKTLKEASESLQEKIFSSINITEKIQEFKKIFKNKVKYPAQDFFNWHFYLTGSCKFGREEFCRNKHINIDKDEFTPEEFINIVKNQYGWENFKELEQYYQS